MCSEILSNFYIAILLRWKSHATPISEFVFFLCFWSFTYVPFSPRHVIWHIVKAQICKLKRYWLWQYVYLKKVWLFISNIHWVYLLEIGRYVNKRLISHYTHTYSWYVHLSTCLSVCSSVHIHTYTHTCKIILMNEDSNILNTLWYTDQHT